MDSQPALFPPRYGRSHLACTLIGAWLIGIVAWSAAPSRAAQVDGPAAAAAGPAASEAAPPAAAPAAAPPVATPTNTELPTAPQAAAPQPAVPAVTQPTVPAPASPAAADEPASSALPPLETSGEVDANPPPAAPLAGEVGPELFLLRDERGRLQAVPGFRFEDFIDLYRLKHQLSGVEDRPRYVITHSKISGTLRNQAVAMSLVLTIEPNDANWLKIPLGLSNSIVEGDPKLDGTGDVFVEFTAPATEERGPAAAPRATERSGYVLWLRAAGRKRVEVTIPLITPVAMVGGETQLRLEAPRATVAQLQVEVPAAEIVARVSDGATLLEPQVGPDKTTFSVLGASGLVELAWRPLGSQLTASPSVLEATGLSWARIDGRSVTFESRLTVRSFGGQFDTFRVRLPQGTQLIGNSQTGASIVPVPATDDTEDLGPVVEVKLEKKTAGPYELRLQADRPRTADNPDELLELAGFEVLGAVRQSGNIGVQVVGNWQALWGDSRGVRQIDDVPEALRRDDLVAAFEYSTQPCSLTVRLAPRRTRVSVQPQYVLTVGAHETRLAVSLKYTIRGAKMRALSVEMPGWEVDDIGPQNVVNVDAAAIDDPAHFSIPLAQPSNGDLTLTITARRANPTGVKPGDVQLLEVPLPRLHAEVVAPAAVVVQPEDNVELTPRSEAFVGLSLRSSRPAVALPALQQDPLFYQTEGAAPKFVADFKVNAQKVVANVETRISLDEQDIQVEERLRYDVLFEPIDKLILQVPRSIAMDKLEVTLDGTRLALTTVRDESERAATGPLLVSAALGGSRIGRCELVAAYRLPQEKLPPSTSVPVVVPLIMPAEEVRQNRAWIRSGPSIVVSVRKGEWSVDERARNNGSRMEGVWLMASQASSSLGLGVTLQDRSREASTLVERAWIQTRLTEDGRAERAIFLLTTSERRLHIQLPAGVGAPAVKAILDGKAVALEAEPRGGFTLPLPGNRLGQQYRLELTYHLAQRDPAGAMALEPPRLLPEIWTRRLYWQVILPTYEHLLTSSQAYNLEMRWQWNGQYWGRRPTIDDRQLEQWLGLAESENSLAASGNSYVFSGAGEYPRLGLRTARRSTLVFGASLAILSAGLLLLYFPAMRNAGLLFAAAVALLAVGLILPDVIILTAQAALLGVVLIAIAIFLSKRMAAKAPPSSPPLTTATHKDRSTTDFYHRTPVATGPPSTATSPMILPTASADSTS